jgi:hypothetical protein
MSNRHFVKDIGKRKTATEKSCRNCMDKERPFYITDHKDKTGKTLKATPCISCLYPEDRSGFRDNWRPLND